MTVLDWIIIALYMLGMIGLSAYLRRGQTDHEDYYVGGRNLPWWAVLFAAILSAAMSSLDSSLNSLSAATLQDFVEKLHRPSPERLMTLGKITTVVWGVIITAFALLFCVAKPADTVIEGINMIGSLFARSSPVHRVGLDLGDPPPILPAVPGEDQPRPAHRRQREDPEQEINRRAICQ